MPRVARGLLQFAPARALQSLAATRSLTSFWWDKIGIEYKLRDPGGKTSHVCTGLPHETFLVHQLFEEAHVIGKTTLTEK